MAIVTENKEIVTAEEMIEKLENRIVELKKEVEGMEKYKKYKEAADETAIIFKAFEDSGFSREETLKIMEFGLEQNRPRLF